MSEENAVYYEGKPFIDHRSMEIQIGVIVQLFSIYPYI